MHTFRTAIAAAACLMLVAPGARAQQAEKTEDADRPKLTIKASPKRGRSGQRVVLTAELVGGADDYEEYYCPTVEWLWGDGTESESTLDCAPYEPGKSLIKRRFTAEHVFRGGDHQVTFRLKRRDKQVAAAVVTIQMQRSAREMLEP
jgi:hypothetical protein